MHVCSFLCAVEDGIQLAFQNRLIALLLFNCPFQLSHSLAIMFSPTDLKCHLYHIQSCVPGFLSEVHILFSYSSAKTIMFNDYNFIVCYFDLVGRAHSSFLFKKFQKSLVCYPFTLADETE